MDVVEKIGSKDSKSIRKTSSTRLKTGTITIRTFFDLKQTDTRGENSQVAIKEEIETSAKSKVSATAKDFKLGMGHETCVNQYSRRQKKWTNSVTKHCKQLCCNFIPNCRRFLCVPIGHRWASCGSLPPVPAFLPLTFVVFFRSLHPTSHKFGTSHSATSHFIGKRHLTAKRRRREYEKELEEEMHRLHVVHFTKGLKHSVRFVTNFEYFIFKLTLNYRLLL